MDTTQRALYFFFLMLANWGSCYWLVDWLCRTAGVTLAEARRYLDGAWGNRQVLLVRYLEGRAADPQRHRRARWVVYLCFAPGLVCQQLALLGASSRRLDGLLWWAGLLLPLYTAAMVVAGWRYRRTVKRGQGLAARLPRWRDSGVVRRYPLSFFFAAFGQGLRGSTVAGAVSLGLLLSSFLVPLPALRVVGVLLLAAYLAVSAVSPWQQLRRLAAAVGPRAYDQAVEAALLAAGHPLGAYNRLCAALVQQAPAPAEAPPPPAPAAVPRRGGPMRGALQKLAGLAFLIGAGWLAAQAVAAYAHQLGQRDWVLTPATVIQVQAVGKGAPETEATDQYFAGGECYTGTLTAAGSRWSVGRGLTVKYNPRDPAQSTARLEPLLGTLLASLAGAAVFAAIGLWTVGFWGYWRRRREKGSR